jgi:hypothetical protein
LLVAGRALLNVGIERGAVNAGLPAGDDLQHDRVLSKGMTSSPFTTKCWLEACPSVSTTGASGLAPSTTAEQASD